jgi:O-acetylhomoserine/O-acetylserine sulfhydrylase-like pyridoxal-dependent enzyme
VTPIGAMGKVTQLTFGVLDAGNPASNLMSANVTGGAASQCADLLHDLKTGMMLGSHPRHQYVAQASGVLGGAVVGSNALIEDIFKYLRTAGATLSAFNAWVILKGCETLSLRLERQSAHALELAQWLERQPQVERVYYPWLASHPRLPQAPRGTGDLLAALFGAGLALGGDPSEVLESSVRNLAARLAQGAEVLLDAPGTVASPHRSPPRGGDAGVTLRRP